MSDSAAPSNRDALYRQALEDFREQRLKEAEARLRVALTIDPRFEDAHEALAVLLYNQKRHDDSIDVLKKWISINPDAIMAHTNLSRCYVAKEMIAEAEHEQAEARRLGWKEELKSKKQAAPKVDYTEKIARYKQVIELDPADVLGYFSLGTAYYDAGQKRNALDTFEKAVEVDASHSSSYLSLGTVLEDLGDKLKAGRVYEKGAAVAAEKGDMIPQKKMEARLRALKEEKKA